MKTTLAIALLICVTLPGCGGSGTSASPAPAPPAPTASLSASPSTIPVGQPSTLTWSTTNASEVSIDAIGTVSQQGSQAVSPTITTTYRLTARGAGGIAVASALVTVQNLQPFTVPSVQEWVGGSGTLKLNPSARIVLASESASATSETAEVLVTDLADLSGNTLTVITGESLAGDIGISLDATDVRLGDEGYCMSIGDRVTISAKGDAGAFYATRTLLQLLKQSTSLPVGHICDWPDYPERGLMVDVAREYFTIPWLQDHIRELSYLKLNTLHLHLTDSEAFRIESSSHPELNSVMPVYTKAEITDLVALAARYHIMVIPEIDLPGHAQIISLAHRDLALPGVYGSLDITVPGTYTIVGDLLDEYLPLFPGPYWHTGGDEYLNRSDFDKFPQFLAFARTNISPDATNYDTFLYFMNWVDSRVKAHGKKTRLWGDAWAYRATTGNAVGLNNDIDIELYSGGNPNTATASEFFIISATAYALYYVGGSPYVAGPDLYEDWKPNLQFDNWLNFDPAAGNYFSITAKDPHLKGAMFEIWCDHIRDPSVIDQETMVPLRAFAQNTWSAEGSKLVKTYGDFGSVSNVIGRAPGFANAPQ